MAHLLMPTLRRSFNVGAVRGWAVAAALFASLFMVYQVRTAPALPPNPHAFMDQKSLCFSCHAKYVGQLDEHTFVVEIPGVCMTCHSPDKLGRSHPIGINPRKSMLQIDPPDDLPLEDDKISCGTCHQPHAPHLSRDKCFPAEETAFTLIESPDKEIPYYKTYFLRKANPEGFIALCTSCHSDF